MKEELPGLIVSVPEASIYTVVDVRNLTDDFDAAEFVKFCAQKGAVSLPEGTFTLLTAPMAGFYSVKAGEPNPGKTQTRIAFVETPDKMKLVPKLFAELFKQYTA